MRGIEGARERGRGERWREEKRVIEGEERRGREERERERWREGKVRGQNKRTYTSHTYIPSFHSFHPYIV